GGGRRRARGHHGERSSTVAAHPDDTQRLLRTAVRAGLREPVEVSSPTSTHVLIDVPTDVQHLKRDTPETAKAWRLAVRQALTAAFAAGYRAVDVLHGEEDGAPVAWYHLERTPPTP
ncbi:MAG: hypothetical protein EA416_02845, partial [Trueperaceae bacterium]